MNINQVFREELKGKFVVLTNDSIIIGKIDDEEITLKGKTEERVFLISGGFGCSPRCNGTLIGGNLVVSGKYMGIRRFPEYIERFATKEEIKKAKKISETRIPKCSMCNKQKEWREWDEKYVCIPCSKN